MITEQEVSARKDEYITVSIGDIHGSRLNPRKVFEEAALQELADSIKEHGILEPIVVRVNRGYEIICGERRWRAAKLAGLEELSVRVLHGIDDRTALEMALTENLARKDIDAIEEAEGLRALMDMGIRATEIAKKINRDPSTISNSVRLLKLPDEVKDHIREGRISPSHGKALVGFVETPKLLEAKLNQALHGVTSKEVEKVEYDWNLINRGAMATVETADVGVEAAKECLKCKHRRRREGRDGWLCIDVDCYEAKAAARKQEIIDQARKNQGLADDTQLPRLRDMAYGTYERLDYIGATPPGCREDCESRGVAIGYQNETVPICTDVKCHRKLKAAAGKAEGKSKREQNKAALARAVSALDAGGIDEEMVLLACWMQIRSAYKEPLRDAIEHLQLPVSDKDITDAYEGKPRETCWKNLLALGPEKIIRLAAEVAIRQEIHIAIRNGYTNHKDTDWLIDRWEHKKAAADQALMRSVHPDEDIEPADVSCGGDCKPCPNPCAEVLEQGCGFDTSCIKRCSICKKPCGNGAGSYPDDYHAGESDSPRWLQPGATAKLILQEKGFDKKEHKVEIVRLDDVVEGGIVCSLGGALLAAKPEELWPWEETDEKPSCDTCGADIDGCRMPADGKCPHYVREGGDKS